MSREKNQSPISASVILQLHHCISSAKGVRKGEISISSENEISVLDRMEDGSTRLIHVMFESAETGGLEVDAEHFAVSPDGNYLLVSVESVLLLIDYQTFDFIDEMTYPQDCKISYIKWINQDTAALVSSKGLLLFDVNNRMEMFIFASYADGVEADDIADVHVDLATNYYLLQIEDGYVGKLQIGRFNSEFLVLDGLTGCLARLDSVYLKGLYAILFTKQPTKQQDFIFRVLPLEEGNIMSQTFKPVSVQIMGLNKSNRPERIIPDTRRCFAYIIFANGFLHIWDFGSDKIQRLFALPLASTYLLDAHPCSDGGFLSAWAGDDRVIRVHLHDKVLLSSLYAKRSHNEAQLLHLAVRMGLPNTTLPALQSLIQAMVEGHRGEVQKAIQPFLEAGQYSNPSLVAHKFSCDPQHRLDLAGYIYSELRNARGKVDWMERVSTFLGQYEDMDTMTVMSSMTAVSTAIPVAGRMSNPVTPVAVMNEAVSPGVGVGVENGRSINKPSFSASPSSVSLLSPVDDSSSSNRLASSHANTNANTTANHHSSQDEEGERLSLFTSTFRHPLPSSLLSHSIRMNSPSNRHSLNRGSVLLTSVHLTPPTTTMAGGKEGNSSNSSLIRTIRSSWRSSLSQLSSMDNNSGHTTASTSQTPRKEALAENEEKVMISTIPQIDVNLESQTGFTQSSPLHPPSTPSSSNLLSPAVGPIVSVVPPPSTSAHSTTRPQSQQQQQQQQQQSQSSYPSCVLAKPPLSQPPKQPVLYNPSMPLVRPPSSSSSSLYQQQSQQSQLPTKRSLPSPPPSSSLPPLPSSSLVRPSTSPQSSPRQQPVSSFAASPIPLIKTVVVTPSGNDSTTTPTARPSTTDNNTNPSNSKPTSSTPIIPTPRLSPKLSAQDYQIIGLLSQIPSSRSQHRDDALVSLLLGFYEDPEQRYQAFQGISAMLENISIDPERIGMK